MKTRRPLAILAATAVAGLGLTALATPASANTTVTITYSDGSGTTFVSPSNASGTKVTFANTHGGFYLFVSEALSDSSGECTKNRQGGECEVGGGSTEVPATATFDIAPDASSEAVTLLDSSSNPVDVLFTVTYSDGTALSAAGGPAPVIQQFEKPATGTCDESQPEGLNWGGASSGGWGESWAQWMHEGQGGAVCTRTLAYNNSTATWQVQ